MLPSANRSAGAIRDDPSRIVPIMKANRSRRPGPAVSVVVPVFNESENVRELHRRLSGALVSLKISYEIIVIDDGSTDETPRLLVELRNLDPHLAVHTLSRNFGHQAAVSAGLDRASGRSVVVVDGDLQDPPELIPSLLDKLKQGFDVVHAVRRGRREGPIKKLGYHCFYRLLNAISETPIAVDSGDFCAMNRKVLDAIKRLPERARFIRGLRGFVGFRQTRLEYDRAPRAGGSPKYSYADLFRLAVDGLVSFSGAPLRLVTYLGLTAAGFSLALMAWVLVEAIAGVHTLPRGWASTVVVVLFMGAVQLLCMGIIGQYIRLIFVETKARPAYLIDRSLPARDPAAIGYEDRRESPDRKPIDEVSTTEYTYKISDRVPNRPAIKTLRFDSPAPIAAPRLKRPSRISVRNSRFVGESTGESDEPDRDDEKSSY